MTIVNSLLEIGPGLSHYEGGTVSIPRIDTFSSCRQEEFAQVLPQDSKRPSAGSQGSLQAEQAYWHCSAHQTGYFCSF